MINSEFIENIPSDFYQGVLYITNAFFEKEFDPRDNDRTIEFYSLLEAFLKANNYPLDELELGTRAQENYSKVAQYFSNINQHASEHVAKKKIDSARDKYNTLFNNIFTYEFTEGDLKRIQQLINELRDLLNESELFTADHKNRLLRKLEKLQSELHKKISDVDRFWGFVGDAGVAIGKFGKDSKPFVDRIREIVDIVWRTQARAEQLPSGTNIPFLKSGKEETSEE